MIDETDKKIVQILLDNARTSFMDIAKRLNISESTARKRISVMEEEGVIKKYRAIVDQSKIGFSCVAIIGIDTKPESYLSVAGKLTELQNIRFVSTSAGDHMIMAEVWLESSNDMRKFLSEKIETIDGVIRTCPALLMERMKE